MGICCSSPSNLPPKLVRQLQNTLKEVPDIFPGTQSCFLIYPSGKLIAQINGGEQIKEGELQVACKLTTAALEFGETLKEKECPVIHIQGETHLFSCYSIAENLLVFYTDIKGSRLDAYDTAPADAKMVEICETLRQLLHGVTET